MWHDAVIPALQTLEKQHPKPKKPPVHLCQSVLVRWGWAALALHKNIDTYARLGFGIEGFGFAVWASCRVRALRKQAVTKVEGFWRTPI